MTAILVLAGVGFVLILTEMFLPGGVLGILGALALLAAVIVGYTTFGPEVGTTLMVAIALVSLVGFCVWMKVFPKTSMGRKLLLGTSLGSGDRLPKASVVNPGDDGVACSALRPSGKAVFSGRRLDVIGESDFIESGQPVTVVAVEGVRIVVRKKA